MTGSIVIQRPTIVIDTSSVQKSFKDVHVPELPEIPGMIKFEEGQYLFWLSNTVLNDGADIVEIGTWLGRSTSFIASGLQQRGFKGKLKCFDHYEWAGGAGWASKTSLPKSRGEDFMPDFLANLSAFEDRIDATKTKIKDIEFGDISIGALVLDAPKRVGDIAAIYKKIADKVTPGQTILAWQDFLHPASFEIPACLGLLTSIQTPVHVVSSGTMVGFQIDRAWAEEDIDEERLTIADWTPSDAQRVWDYWKPIIPAREAASFESGLCMLLHDLNHIDEAIARLRPLLLDDYCRKRWIKWNKTSLRDRYFPLFNLLSEVG